jgi:hypothetical protein
MLPSAAPETTAAEALKTSRREEPSCVEELREFIVISLSVEVAFM